MDKITLQIPNITKELLESMGIDNDEAATRFLYPSIDNLYNYKELDNLPKAIDIFIKHLKNKSNILFYCDYDVDGCSSGSILMLGLEKIIKEYGAKAKLRLPTRSEGYGMNIDVLKNMLKTFPINLVVTADNGIKCVEEIAFCKENGIEVIVLDHHTPDMKNLPIADCLVDLYMENTSYPFKHLCGASLSFKLVLGVNDTLGKDLNPIYNLLQYAAIATIADVVSLTDENRLIVQLGLDILNKNPSIGMKALLEELNHQGPITSETINYKIAPCLNAPGRIHTPNISVQLMISNNIDFSKVKAKEVVDLNTQRKEMTEKFCQKGFDYIKDNYNDSYVYVIPLEGCLEGIIGLVAGRIKEKYNKPTIILTPHKGAYVGSARSIKAFDINSHLNTLSDYLIRFGGHPLAAGLSIKEENIDEFREKLNQGALEILTEKDFIKTYNPFRTIKVEEVKEYYNAITLLEPFGQDNQKPLFNFDFKTVINPKTQNHYDIMKDKYLKLFGDSFVSAISFDEDMAKKYILNGSPRDLNVKGYLSINVYNNFTNYQVNIINI